MTNPFDKERELQELKRQNAILKRDLAVEQEIQALREEQARLKREKANHNRSEIEKKAVNAFKAAGNTAGKGLLWIAEQQAKNQARPTPKRKKKTVRRKRK